MRSFKALLFTLAIASTNAWPSKNIETRTKEACEAALETPPAQLLEAQPSAKNLIPLCTMLGSRKCDHIPIMWRSGDVYARRYPTEGLAQMYNTAKIAADELLSKIPEAAVRPEHDWRDPFKAAAETIELVRSAKNTYIRNAVIIREGVVMFAPLLWRTKDDKGKFVYVPIVAKGHQELEDTDLLYAAFAAWGLEPWQGTLIDEAGVYLKPMVEKRAAGEKNQNRYYANVHALMPQIQKIYKKFMDQAEKGANDPSIARDQAPERRCTQCNLCPWAANCRAKLDEQLHTSMMPLPPTKDQAAALDALGYDDTNRLAALKVESKEFFEVALRTEIPPERLAYFVAHSISKKENKVIVMEPFQDPLAGQDLVVDIDFEDMLNPDVRSGVYLFGVRISKIVNGKVVLLEKQFVWAEKKFDQESVDEAWFNFLQIFKKNPLLKGKKYKITTYSKHEQVKVEQQFDILKQKPSEFTAAERNSPFYSEVEVNGKPVGRLIRRREYFRKYPSIKPADIFGMLDKTLDILDYVRKNLAFPSYTNSLKKAINYARPQDGKIVYDKGADGLASVAWANEYYQTLDPKIREKIQIYNGIDIDGNAVILSLVRSMAGQAKHEKLMTTETYEEARKKLGAFVRLKAHVTQLRKKEDLLTKLFGKPLGDLKDSEFEELLEIVDRTSYLEKREKLNDSGEPGDKETDEKLQRLRHEHVRDRISELSVFAEHVNPNFHALQSDEVSEAFAELTDRPDSFLTPQHLKEIIVLEQFPTVDRPQASTTPFGSLKLFADYLANFDVEAPLKANVMDLDDFEQSDIERLWKGYQLQQRFPLPKKPEK